MIVISRRPSRIAMVAAAVAFAGAAYAQQAPGTITPPDSVTAARGQQAPVWYLVGNDEGHGFAKKKNQDYLFYASVAFVRQYLLKEPLTDTAER